MLYDLFGIVVVIVVDVVGFLHKRRYGARRVFDDVRLELVQFRECLERKKKKTLIDKFLITL